MGRQWLQFGPYRLDAISCTLLRGSKPVPLTPKEIEMLRVLVRAGPSVVTKEMFFELVWPGTFVEETSITRNISELRSALGDYSSGTSYIETIPKRGYRFVAPVQHVYEDITPSQKTLAVLPFRILGAGVGDGSIGLRIADALITKLATIRVCAVRPTRSVSQYEHSGDRRPPTGQDLDVDFVVDGSVQEFVGRIRVTVQLLDSKANKPVWGATFDEEPSDALRIQDSLAEQLAGALALFIRADDRKLLSRRYTESSEAYQLYLRGRFHWNKRSESGLQTAIQWFRKAIRLDPEFALAYSGLAASYAMLPMLAAVPAKRFMPRARTAAVSALDLDDSLVEAHAALAFVRWHYDWDWRRAEREFKIALEFHPSHATIHQWYGLLLVEMGRFAEGIAEAKKAQALEPGSAAIRANSAAVLYLAGRYQESIDVGEESLALNPESLRAHLVIGMSLEQMGRVEEAIAIFEKARRLFPDAPEACSALGHASGIAGHGAEANSALTSLRGRRPRCCFFEEALVALGLGNLTEAVQLLQRACEEKQFQLVILRTDARFARLRSRLEFQAILSRIGPVL